MKLIFFTNIVFIMAMLVACGDEPVVSTSDKTATTEPKQDFYVGCYTIDKNTPASIKVSQVQGGYKMQMKEPNDAATAWDTLEPLLVLAKQDGWKYFSTNAINLSVNDITDQVIARPDGLLVIAKLHDASTNTNPMLDSRYAVALMGAVNTIYQVACDDKRINLIQDFQNN